MWLCSLLLLLPPKLLVLFLEPFDILALAFIFVGCDHVNRSAAHSADCGCGKAYGGAGNLSNKAARQQRG